MTPIAIAGQATGMICAAARGVWSAALNKRASRLIP